VSIFDLHEQLIADDRDFVQSFFTMADTKA
jgi:hypothetical protein